MLLKMAETSKNHSPFVSSLSFLSRTNLLHSIQVFYKTGKFAEKRYNNIKTLLNYSISFSFVKVDIWGTRKGLGDRHSGEFSGRKE